MADTLSTGPVHYERDGEIAVLTLDNPPVNALAKEVRVALARHLEKVVNDDEVTAIVICGAGRNLCGGADIREFNTPARDVKPMSRDLVNLLEDCPKPMVALIHGPTLGGGLELALGCHYRVAKADAQIGLPEVQRGVIPGAGGTQRLPRLIGLEAALDMITTGVPVNGEKALELGIVDAIVSGLRTAVAFARQVIDDNRGPRRISAMKVAGDPDENATIIANYRTKLAKTSRGLLAPFHCLESVANAVTLPFDEGWEREAEISRMAMASAESRSLVHAFFAERQVAKIPDIPADIALRPINKAAIIGAGTMGGGIAMSFANAGIPVTVIEASQENLDNGMQRIQGNYDATRKRGRLSDDEMAARLGRITPSTDYADMADADIVIEAVFEEMDVKQSVFAEIDRLARDDAILATNTSTLDVDAIAQATKRPESVLGTHFFSPANVMTLLEVVRAEKTSQDVVASVMAMAKAINKVGVVVGVCDGFVGNRMLAPYFRQGDFLVEEGALPQDVDRVIEEYGFRMGPFRVSDLAGLDISWAIEKRRAETRPADERFSPLLDSICQLGRYGQKTGAGWYRYEDGRTALPDPVVEELIVARSREMDLNRRPIGDEEILQRCLYSMINEGAKILEEGLAIRASDIDVIWLNGYGFPRHRGGPMFYGDTVGLRAVCDTLDRCHREWGDKWQPAALLRQLANAGSSFAEWDKRKVG
ncbi:MAG: 3-hydroxyacyl-CoA dehydrogenase NAD-binding domain-containing protein [Alphaproteobacteria bacterium]|nr:3-hydroxyacyl-CoA dehydrogenase NAD-binding domain-containing protein [Alphaproteobacteria bacterium]